MKINKYLYEYDVRMYNQLYVNLVEKTPSNKNIAPFLVTSLLRLRSALNLLRGFPDKSPTTFKFIPNYQYYIFLSCLQTINISAQNIEYKKGVDNGNEVCYLVQNVAPSPSSLLGYHLNYTGEKHNFSTEGYIKVLVDSNKKISLKELGKLLNARYFGLREIFETPISRFSPFITGNPKVRQVDNLTKTSQTMIINEANFMIGQFS